MSLIPSIWYKLVPDSTQDVSSGLGGQDDGLHQSSWDVSEDRPHSTSRAPLLVLLRGHRDEVSSCVAYAL